MLRKANLKEFKKLYRKHIIKDFPREERRSLNKFKKRVTRGSEEVYIYEEDGKEKAYTIVAVLNNYIMVSFLAVYKEFRGEGIGTKLLSEIKDNFSNKKGILLEVEDPDFSKDQKEEEIRKKRIRFYKKSNYNIVDGVKISSHSIIFDIMILNISNTKIDKQEIAKELNDFYINIFKRYDKTLSFKIIVN